MPPSLTTAYKPYIGRALNYVRLQLASSIITTTTPSCLGSKSSSIRSRCLLKYCIHIISCPHLLLRKHRTCCFELHGDHVFGSRQWLYSSYNPQGRGRTSMHRGGSSESSRHRPSRLFESGLHSMGRIIRQVCTVGLHASRAVTYNCSRTHSYHHGRCCFSCFTSIAMIVVWVADTRHGLKTDIEQAN